MDNILVTGGLGFIGANLVRLLVDQECQVRVLDNQWRGSLDNLGICAGQVEFLEGDVRDASCLMEAARGVDTVFHLAAINGTRFFYEIPDQVLEVNVKGTINALEAAVAHGVAHFVFASSSEVYNEPTKLPTPETERILIPDITNPRFSYSGSKIIGELFCLNYARQRGFRTTILRYHNVYGPAMGFEHVIPEFALRMLLLHDQTGKTTIDFPIQGTGEETRAFCYVADAVEATLLAVEQGEGYPIYNVGNRQEEVSIQQLAAMIGDTLRLKVCIQPGLGPKGSTPRRCPNTHRLENLEYRPHTPLAQGLVETCAWYAAYYKQQKNKEVLL